MNEQNIKRVRMFAGPNGSGKSTLKSVLPAKYLGIFLNADELEHQLKHTQKIDLSAIHPDLKANELIAYLHQQKHRATSNNLITASICADFTNCIVDFTNQSIDSYLCAEIIEFIRAKLLTLGVSFSFETVMSHASKVNFLKQAQQLGYKTYLYYVATIDPKINIARVQQRVEQGGHDVPIDKIKKRYFESLKNLISAIDASDRAFIFDNSAGGQQQAAFIAEIEQGQNLHIQPTVEQLPT